MAISNQEISEWAEKLDRAEQTATALDRITKSLEDLDLTSAYDIQDKLLELRVNRGEKIIGYKMGLTSKAKMEQMGVDDPIMGVLTDKMRVDCGESLMLGSRIHARVEPEVAFKIKHDLSGKVSRSEVAAACEWICLALEVIDSRYTNFDFKLPDVLADNCSSSGLVLGKPIADVEAIACDKIQLRMSFNDHIVQEGSTAAILGHPMDSVAALVMMLDARGKILPAKSIVLAGAATAAVALEKGCRVSVKADGFKSADFLAN